MKSLAHCLAACAERWEGAPEDIDALVARVGSARIVLIGEASHGTHEFYRVRAEITKRLIRERAFRAVAVEGDWPDAHRVHRYVSARGADRDASEALQGFERFPQWMWRNADVLDFVGWLRGWNEQHGPIEATGFYGLDLYSLHRSIDAVLRFLRVVDPEAERRARRRYACFEHFGADPQGYGRATALGLEPSCERAVVEALVELQRSAGEYAQRDGRLEPGEVFFAQQNARLVVDAERYYRALFGSRASSWNVRDQHMFRTLTALDTHVGAQMRQPAKIVVWAHNSHVGDARATELGRGGEINLGELARASYGDEVVSIGFTTHSGTVTAASDWGAAAECKRVRDALPGSFERLFHDLDLGHARFDLRRVQRDVDERERTRLERAIGVIYRPDTERSSHYFHADLARQFDVVVHFDRTRAVEPLERSAEWERGELPDTFPSAL